MRKSNNLKTRLFIWYGGSLLLVALFFWFGVHVLSVKYGTEIFIGLLLLLSLVGFFIIQKITNSLSDLTEKIQTISSKNLNERIINISNEDEIGMLARSFNALLDRLELSFHRERQFIGDVAHELKTPIATMKSSIEVALSRDRNKEEYKQILLESLEDVNNMSTTLADVLDLAWTEANTDRQFTKKVDLSALISEVTEIGTKLAQVKKVKLRSSIQEGIVILGEREKLARAILNLLDNAIKYNNKGGSIQIKVEKQDSLAVLTVKDSGIGISHQEIHQIFNRFYRGTKTNKISGSGLGLAIVKSIIQMHQGKITVKSKPNKGTTFTIAIPLA